ncbi:putative cardiolipin synthase [Idiomarina aquatica]|uniref:Putative cardiolipin synthase n=2 Tax=Idiomarina aquatica TaxID=1327752 RepID=A0A4R6NZ08_9GAMM|nr:putative cardiolipin synthase [Idiomarina aquatica]
MLSLNACALPARSDPESSNALPSHKAAETALGRQLAERIQGHPCCSGIYPLVNPTAAFAARGLLADAAERKLDIQYYIWQKDTTGLLLFNTVYSAAERGVRVRLLLDDFGVSGLDDELAALDIHPNIEVRLFNPFIIRNPKLIGFVTQFPQANRRMHNKSFTVDDQVTIIGGRNIGDEYFGAAQEMLFSDLDVIAVGAIVNKVSTDFDRYWVSDSVYPVSLILPSPEGIQQQEIMEGITSAPQRDGVYTYIEALRQSDVVRNMLEGTLPLEWAESRMISDDPAKGLGQAEQDALLVSQMSEILGNPGTNLELVSPYFVPTEAGTEAFVKLAEQGVNIRILTNSMEATDVAAVHAGIVNVEKIY